MRSSLICELINFIFYCKITLPLYYINTILKKQVLVYTFISTLFVRIVPYYLNFKNITILKT
ncbi:hypothetical protein CJ306_29615 (plasmid) [Bacillus cereus]|nr:hypothetical protein CJ306_29615 [Bacillus cereus]